MVKQWDIWWVTRLALALSRQMAALVAASLCAVVAVNVGRPYRLVSPAKHVLNFVIGLGVSTVLARHRKLGQTLDGSS